MAQQDATTAHDTDHDGHGRDPGEDSRFLGLILVLVGIGLAWGIGRHIPGSSPHEEGAAAHFDGVVTLSGDRGELRGRVVVEDDLIRVQTAEGLVMLSRSQVHRVQRVDTSARPSGRGIVVLTTGQVFVGRLESTASGVRIDGLEFPRGRVRWSQANAEELDESYWRKYPHAEIDPRWSQDSGGEQSALPTPEPSPVATVRDAFPPTSPTPTVSTPTPTPDPTPATTPGETKDQHIKRLVDRARYLQVSLQWPEAAEAWFSAYTESGQPNHLRDIGRCLARWAGSDAGTEQWAGRYERIEAIARPVRSELRTTLGPIYNNLFDMLASPEHVGLMERIRDSLAELGGYELEVADMDSTILVYKQPEAEGHGPDDGHGH